MRILFLAIALAVTLAGCGSSNPVAPSPAATSVLDQRQQPDPVPPSKDYYWKFGENTPTENGVVP